MNLILRFLKAGLAASILVAAGCAGAPTSDAEATFKEGIKLAEGGNVAQAIKTLQQGVDDHPSHVRMRFELSRLQYESGEPFHQRERRFMRRAAEQVDRGRRSEAIRDKQQAAQARAKALPFYTAAKTNLEEVVEEELDERRAAWAFYLLMRVNVFFEEYEEAHDHIEQAIILGRPTGPLLAAWREYQAGLKEKMRGN